ncbi:Retinol dehydrogenase 12 [Aphelenchoides avenae]|nr:Retinol dehydrogenase 12 [Aphelenchus avenae]
MVVLNKSVLITGGNQGIGLATSRLLARKGYNVTIACRNEVKAVEVLDLIQAENASVDVDYVLVDLASMQSVKECGRLMVAEGRHNFDFIVLNAGVMLPSEKVTADGFESSFQVNYLAQYFLLSIVLGHRDQTRKVKVVTLTSVMHRLCGSVFPINFEKFECSKRNQWRSYASSKFATAVMALNLNKLHNVTAVTVHPGAVRTNMTNNISNRTRKYLTFLKSLLISAEDAAQNVVGCMENPQPMSALGLYQHAGKVNKLSKSVRRPANGEALEKMTQGLLQQFL